MPQSVRLTPKFKIFAVVFCLLPVTLLAQQAKLGAILSSNQPTATTIVAFRGFLGQPTVGNTTTSTVSFKTSFVRTTAQFTSETPTGVTPDVPVVYNFGLNQNYPNPFNPTTVIPFSLDRAGDASLTIFNLLGQQIRSFDFPNVQAGDFNITWDGRTQNGSLLPSGEYFVRLSHDSRMQVRKLTLLK